ncbi:hypothetical protein IC234_01610 [Hymenobacter sp. BT189]|uniref:Apea-like HEPN domain-containing protein n=2 Tax=Hymenobacter armeniacus TaxID=2771358 RepID=A0ABR8JS93_9BACT|nr:hypothetical protein [Hymenobacter armeniacus]
MEELLASPNNPLVFNPAVALDYFRRRYITDYSPERQHSVDDFNMTFHLLHPATTLDRRVQASLEKIENALLNSTNQTNPHYAVLAILYRYRNNLFHGEKAVVSLNGQRNNFIVANKVLYEILDHNRTVFDNE